MEYKDTLNLPVTAFPMKANLAQKELEILDHWEKTSLYEKLVAAGKDKPKYILHDGPLTPTAISTPATPSTRSSRTSSSKASG